MRSATLGSHVPRVRPAHMNADQVGFSSPRRQKRAQRGYVSNVMLSAQGPRSRTGYARGLEFSPGVKRRTLAKRVGIAVAVVAVLAAVAYGVGSFTLMGNLNGKLALKDSDAAKALTAVKSVLHARRGRARYPGHAELRRGPRCPSSGANRFLG